MNDRVTADSALMLCASDLAELTPHGILREYRARTVLLTEGDESGGLYVILEGRVRAYVDDANGHEATLSVMGPGEYFGEITFDQGPRSASVVTLEPCRLLVVPQSDFAAVVARNPAFANHFINKLIRQVRVLTANVRSLALMDAYGRIANLLLGSAVKKDGLHYVPERLTQAGIASSVGCSREMVSRIFKDLVAGGYITLEPDRIVIQREPPARW